MLPTLQSIRHRLAAGSAVVLAAGMAGGAAGGAAGGPATIICAERADAERTRVVLELDGRPRRLLITTPEFLWSDPAQPETSRFPAGQTDVSPNLAGRDDVAVTIEQGARGELRAVWFAVRTPDALALAGLRGSLLLHESWQSDAAAGSLHYSATGNLDQIVPVQCQRFAD